MCFVIKGKRILHRKVFGEINLNATICAHLACLKCNTY